MTAIKIGDRIKFRAVTRWGAPVLWRKVVGFFNGEPTVRAHGCNGFIVHEREILDHEPA